MNKKDILEKAKKNLEGWLMQQQKCLQDELDLLKKCEFSDYYSFLQVKSEILERYFLRSALYIEHCPFCLEYRKDLNANAEGCVACPYGETHGICYEPGSVFQLLTSIKRLLVVALWVIYPTKTISDSQLATLKQYFGAVKTHLNQLMGRGSVESREEFLDVFS